MCRTRKFESRKSSISTYYTYYLITSLLFIDTKEKCHNISSPDFQDMYRFYYDCP